MHIKRPTEKSIRNTPEVRRYHQFVTLWLNAELDLPPQTRAELGYSDESRDRILRLLKVFRSEASAMYDRAKRQKVGELTLSIDALEPYATYTNLVFNLEDGSWRSSVLAAKSNAFPEHETLAAYGLAELTKLYGLERLRLCGCGRWYFATQKRSPACSTSCRKTHWDQKPANKEARKQRDRKNRANPNTGLAAAYARKRAGQKGSTNVKAAK